MTGTRKKLTELLEREGIRYELLPHRHTKSAGEEAEVELGAVPPVGGPADDRVVVDRRLADLETIVIEAGSHDESVRLATTDLLVLAHAAIGDLCLADAA